MDTFQFYLTEMGFVSVILIILSLVITFTLCRGKSKSRSDRLFIGFFGSVIANGVTMLIANAWYPGVHLCPPRTPGSYWVGSRSGSMPINTPV